jgi:putative cell wall-binding protein
MPLIISTTQPSTIYSSPTQWTWYTPGDISTGAAVTINALGFTPGESTTVNFVDETLFYANGGSDFTGAEATSVTATADGEGAVTAQVIIPAGWASGDLLDALVAGSTSRYLLISGGGVPDYGDPSIQLTDTVSAFPGGAVSVSAGGYYPGATVTIALHSPSARALQLGTLTADGAGNILGTVYLPVTTVPGSYRVWAGAKTADYLLLNTALTIGNAPVSSRVAGASRYETAVATSQLFDPFSSGTGTVYLTSGLTFPDALGAGALAAEIGAPVLLTNPTALPDAVLTELARLHPAHVKIVGGTSAVSAAVFNVVQGLAVRLGGADRYETNRLLIADALPHASTVYIATGSNFPDALAAGPAAATLAGAVILVNGSASSLDQATLDLLTSLGVTHVVLVGGTGVMSTGIESQLKTLYPSNVERVAGSDRYDTAAQIVAGAWPSTAPKVILVSGVNFPDALAAGALGLPMLTSPPTCVPAVILARLGALQPTAVMLVGGTGALSNGVAQFAHC